MPRVAKTNFIEVEDTLLWLVKAGEYTHLHQGNGEVQIAFKGVVVQKNTKLPELYLVVQEVAGQREGDAKGELIIKTQLHLCRTLQGSAEVKLRLNDEFALRIPLSLTSDLLYNEVQLWEFGVFLDYHPFKGNLYLSVSLVQMGIFTGFDKPEERILYLNEVGFGYTWHITKRLSFEPRLVICDPSGVFEAEYALVMRTFPDRSKFRLSLLFGWEFLAIPNR